MCVVGEEAIIQGYEEPAARARGRAMQLGSAVSRCQTSFTLSAAGIVRQQQVRLRAMLCTF